MGTDSASSWARARWGRTATSPPLDIDGLVGTKTCNATKAWQERENTYSGAHPDVDGSAGKGRLAWAHRWTVRVSGCPAVRLSGCRLSGSEGAGQTLHLQYDGEVLDFETTARLPGEARSAPVFAWPGRGAGRGGCTRRPWRRSALTVAAEVDRILADKRGWTNSGATFRRVDQPPYDFLVRLATPGTTDTLCAQYGLDTGGEVNCSSGKDVVVNLKRWVLLSPYYQGQPAAYHALIINHEVGHRPGRGHRDCPGPGRPAPAMMQQIKGGG
ncbi:DUF3152 domain-containing protein [Streptomyces sp. NPDC001970]